LRLTVGRLGDDLIPSLNVTQERVLATGCGHRRRQLLCAPSSNLKTIASAVLFDRQPRSIVRCAQWRRCSMGGVRRCFQCSAGNRRTPVACPVLAQQSAPSRIWSIALDEGVEPSSAGPWFRPSRSPATAFCFRLLVSELASTFASVQPAALLARFSANLHRRPSRPERAIGMASPTAQSSPAL